MNRFLMSLTFLAGLSLCLPACNASDAINKSAGKILHFPAGYSVGKLNIVDRDPHLETNIRGRFWKHAKGDIVIPPNTLILFEADGKFFQHPECLLKLPADAFDFIRLKFTSLDANEEAMSDNAMRFVKHLSKLRTVSFDQSDTTDKGVSLLAGFEKLEAISCGDTLVTGKCLSDLLTCKNLKFIRISAVQIANEELRHLQKLPLKRLSLGRCALKPSGLKYVSQCSGIENLDIGHNPDINDTCIPHIMKMKELKELTVADTKISFKGMMQLSHQKIARITFPGSRSQYTSSQLKSISKAFPHVDFMEISPERVDADYQQLFSPTSH